jgi:L-aminopeptidase/D-esterase-like protein
VTRLSNDLVDLTPRTDVVGPQLDFELSGLEIGCAEYDEGPTGCTVFHFPEGAAMQVDVRGGSPGTLGAQYEWVDAICLAGGSLYGLEAATGVAAELFARHEYSTGWMDIPLVAGAIVFDYGRRDNGIYPDKELGRAALRAARPGVFPLGRRGAGRAVSVGKTFDFVGVEWAGQGGAFRTLGDTRIAVFTVVNAVGAVVDREGTVVRGHLDEATGERHALVPRVEERLTAGVPAVSPDGNTTLTVVVTNAQLDSRLLRTLGRQVHASIARAIQPFHALVDGDVLFAVTTNEVEEELSSIELGVVASELAWDAVLSAVSQQD